MMQIPRIETERLILREFRPEDFDAYAEIMANPNVTRYLSGGTPLTRVEAWKQLAMLIGHWTLRGYGHWAVEERETGRLMGRVGCFYPEGWPSFEVAYTLGEPYWGKGYAREAAAVALRYAREVVKRDDITSIIRPGNVGSIKVATSLGAACGEEIPFFGSPAFIYRYPRLSS